MAAVSYFYQNNVEISKRSFFPKCLKSITPLNVQNLCGKRMEGVMTSIILKFANMMVEIVVEAMLISLFVRSVNVNKVATLQLY